MIKKFSFKYSSLRNLLRLIQICFQWMFFEKLFSSYKLTRHLSDTLPVDIRWPTSKNFYLKFSLKFSLKFFLKTLYLVTDFLLINSIIWPGDCDEYWHGLNQDFPFEFHKMISWLSRKSRQLIKPSLNECWYLKAVFLKPIVL